MTGLLGGGVKAPPPPVAPPTVPTPDSNQVLLAKKKSVATQASRSGRQSTILTQQTGFGSDKLGGT